MKQANNSHLLEEQIFRAVIDEKDLSTEDHLHLLQCPDCTNRVRHLQEGLHVLGEKARQAVPPFSRPVRLPDKRPVRVSHSAGWLPFFGAAAMAGLVVFFYFMGMETMSPGPAITLQNQARLLEDESLMEEISEMVDNPLSDELYEISGDNGTGLDEDFLQFVVPSIQDDFQSEIFIQDGGLQQC